MNAERPHEGPKRTIKQEDITKARKIHEDRKQRHFVAANTEGPFQGDPVGDARKSAAEAGNVLKRLKKKAEESGKVVW